VEEQTGSLNKEESSERLKFAHMLVNILKIMLNGRKKKTNKNKNKWSDNSQLVLSSQISSQKYGQCLY
jgi:hypothetical protein